MIMALNRLLKKSAGASGTPSRPMSGRVRSGVAMVGIAVLGLSLALGTANAADTSAPQTGTILFGTLDTQPGTVAAEAGSSDVSVAMFEFDWASFEPSQGVFSASYLATMESYLQAYQAAGMKVTLGLGLEDPPSWVFSLPDATYVNQYGAQSNEANFVFSAAVRQAAAGYLTRLAADIPLSSFWAIRLTSGGDSEMLYPGGGTYWAFDNAALTGNGLAAGMTPNPDPNWTPGTPGLSQAQIDAWVNWYVGGLDNVTNWQMQTLSGLGFNGYYQTVTPGSGTRPDGLARDELFNLSNDGTTGMGAVWDRYYGMLPDKTNVVAYVSSVADNSGGNDDCQAADATTSLTSRTMDSWSATRWISAIAHQNGLLVGGENPGYGQPVAFDFDYLNTSSSGMMADALGQAQSCGFQVFYWAHDVHLWDGTLPFSIYANFIAPYASPPDNLALAGSLAASNTRGGFPASNGNDNNLSTYWQAAEPTATLTLQLAQPSPVDRVLLELPPDWPTRDQTIEVDGSADGTTWTTLAPAAAYTFTARDNAIAIPVPAGTQDYLRLDISGNTVMGAPQIAEFQAYSN
jgi:F5/8 type C domain/Beta-galactosidase